MSQRTQRLSLFTGRWSVYWALCCAGVLLGILLCASQPAIAQFAVLSAASTNDAKRPFILPSHSLEVVEAMEDFRRHARRGIWERALESLEIVTSAGSDALFAGEDGIMLPSGLLVRQTLADLPAAGKNAYRLFHDAEAKALLEQAEGENEVIHLTKTASTYLFTSVGDTAADRLGDIYFERGDMLQAVKAWQSILTYRPDTTISRVRLLVKIGIALARTGRWKEFREIERQVQERHADEAVTLGGESVSAVEHLAHLVETADVAGEATNDGPADRTLPATSEPMWQFRIQENGNGDEGQIQFVDQFGRQTGARMGVPAAADDTRVYANLLGYAIALDLKTGKLLWSTGNFDDLAQKVNQNVSVLPERYSIAVGGDHVWFVSRDPDQLAQHQSEANFYLICREAETGKEIFNSKNVPSLKSWIMVGAPLPVGDRVYVAALKSGQPTEQYVLAVAAVGGKLLWSTHIGTHQVDPTQVFYQRSPQPMLTLHGEKLYVDTNAGALVELETATGMLNWGIQYESDMPSTEYYYYKPSQTFTVGRPVIADGKLCVKGMRSSRLYALNPDKPAVLWKRPVLNTSMLIGMDDERVYLGGEELTAYDWQTHRLLWSYKIPLGSGWTRPVMTRNRLYQFSPRGVYEVDKATGRVVRLFRGKDLESLGGGILLTPNTLITVSSLAITAYPAEESSSESEEDTKNLPAVTND